MADKVIPIKLVSSRAWRTYIGGKTLDEMHGIYNTKDSHFPEEWIMSITRAINSGRENIEEGLCYLDGSNQSFKDYIEENSELKLGVQHCKDFGTTTGVLVKIIDAAERLTIQVHPDKMTAYRLFSSQFGKTECWHILGGREIDGEVPSIYLGFKEGIKEKEWKECFEKQDIAGMLNMLHHIPVLPGETYLINGGVPHAIGKGCLLVEIQEPTDYTIRVERTTPSGFAVADDSCHQGLGFDKMMECFSFLGHSLEETKSLWKIEPKILISNEDYKVEEIIGYDNTPCFKLEKIEVFRKTELKDLNNFSGLYILKGKGTISGDQYSIEINQGNQLFVPAGTTKAIINAEQTIILFRFFGPQKKEKENVKEA